MRLQSLILAAVLTGIWIGWDVPTWPGNVPTTWASAHNQSAAADSFTVNVNQDCEDPDLKSVPGANVSDCVSACNALEGCAAFVFTQGGGNGNTCFLKGGCAPKRGCVSGSTCLAAVRRAPLEKGVCPVTVGFDCAGEDVASVLGSSPDECCGACQRTAGCGAYVFVDWRLKKQGTCYLKSSCALSAGCKGKVCTAGVLPVAGGPSPAPAAVAPLGWEEAYENASAMVKQMDRSEKYNLMRGIGAIGKWNYVGNTAPVHRLNIPSISMQDAAGGFRTTSNALVGTVTCWPSLLAMAATWDTEIMLDFATALGEEFSAKGANMILGPSINVHRQGWNGRNFEYLSGEDPFLGARLTEQYVRGVQGQGVMAVMKHFAFNHQETDRRTFNAIVDDKTAWELYYPPYQAAVDAGVSATMCSYNREDGTNTCANGRRLNEDLKGAMGFKGFIQSDWGATEGTDVDQGLDQDMPGSDGHYDDEKLDAVSDALIDDSAKRALAAMYHLRLFDGARCNPEDKGCESLFESDVRGSHAALARAAATESVVLLKNEGDVLPLRAGAVRTIAIVGLAADSSPYNPNGLFKQWYVGDHYSGGGSGHVMPGRLVKPVDAIRDAASARGIDVVVEASDDVAAASLAASQADVTIVVAGTTSGESKDRSSLDLDGDMGSFIPAVAAASKKTVVLAQIPGQILTPWRDSAEAILALFLGGDETGSAWASVLFGEHAPTGHLPIMLPESESDSLPSLKGDIVYSEGMATSYRNKHFHAAFPFGHGLTYTTFDYGAPLQAICGDHLCVKLQLKNSGAVAARTVAQLYLAFPPEAGHPAPLLKGFAKTSTMGPGQTQEVSFVLQERDSLSYWQNGSWIKTPKATAHIGASSADIRVSLDLDIAEGAGALTV